MPPSVPPMMMGRGGRLGEVGALGGGEGAPTIYGGEGAINGG